MDVENSGRSAKVVATILKILVLRQFRIVVVGIAVGRLLQSDYRY